MVDFALTDEQRALLDVVRRFVARTEAPAAASLDRRPDPADCFSPRGESETIRTGERYG